ncbi:MAG TPA: TolC family protein [Dysgonamonadaceae bacterium]|jgi:outer membrane protein|nr:TolC family protein [Dysgonamonadaceae bacterium]
MEKDKIKNRIRKYILFLSLTLPAGMLFSQQNSLPQQWDLQTCIDYALANNIQVKQAVAGKESSKVDTKQARAALLPSLSASINQNLSNYPFPTDNSSTSSATGSYGLNASWQIFDGGVRTNNIKQADINDEIALLNIEESKNNIKLSIIQNYLQILYADEAVKTCENAVELSAEQLESNKEKLKTGTVTKSDVAQWESQHASDLYQLTNAKVTLENYKLQLKQLLELDTLETMNIVIIEPDEEEVLTLLPDKNFIYQTAMNVMPQIKSSKLETEYSELGIAKAKADYLPKISLQAGAVTGNVYDHSIYDFGTQLKNNWNNTIGISVSIPIFSNREIKSAVEKAQINVETSKLNGLSIQKELHANIETAYLNAINAQSQYIAAKEKVKSSTESYNVLDEQFRLGLRNTIELLTEKNTLINAQHELLQAKYMALLSRKVLDYYQGLI